MEKNNKSSNSLSDGRRQKPWYWTSKNEFDGIDKRMNVKFKSRPLKYSNWKTSVSHYHKHY